MSWHPGYPGYVSLYDGILPTAMLEIICACSFVSLFIITRAIFPTNLTDFHGRLRREFDICEKKIDSAIDLH